MENFFYFCLFIFGTLFGSFASVLIYRLKSNEWWIMSWRSHCTSCNNILKAFDLIPIFSWIKNKAKCSNCKAKVASIYPLLELTTWLLFAFIWYFLIDFELFANFNINEIMKLIFWLIIWFLTITYSFYDILFLEIHDWVLISWIALVLLVLILQIFFPNIIILDLISNNNNDIILSIFAIIISLIIIWLLYLIMLKELDDWKDIWLLTISIWSLLLFKYFTGHDLSDFAILSSTVWALSIFLFFYIQILISKWQWMWWWDLRIGILVWLVLGISYSFAWLMLTYFVWSFIWICFVLYSRFKNSNTELNTAIPFWPFLAIWFFITIFYSNEILNLMNKYIY
jgi:prepilin signal peptidase PulO-like enzyme (type II secretory pathway)